MARNLLSSHHSLSSSPSSSSSSSFDEEEEEDYIDLEVTSYSIFHCPSTTSPNMTNREFEFQMSSTVSLAAGEPTTTSPADELFYKGKLLPLHLPPRLQMVEKLLQTSNEDEEFYATPIATPPSTPNGINSSTPFASCHVSGELNPEDYFSDYMEDVVGESTEFGRESPKKSWTRKIKLIKQSLLSTKLKTPKSYIKSLFVKSSCTHESCATTIYEGSAIKAKDKDRFSRKGGLNEVTRSFRKESEVEKDQSRRRRSVSVTSKRHFVNKDLALSSSSSSSSSSCSSDSNGFNEVQFLKRINGECPIQGAIKHCKQSQHAGRPVVG